MPVHPSSFSVCFPSWRELLTGIYIEILKPVLSYEYIQWEQSNTLLEGVEKAKSVVRGSQDAVRLKSLGLARWIWVGKVKGSARSTLITTPEVRSSKALTVGGTAPMELLSGQQMRLWLYWAASRCECVTMWMWSGRSSQRIPPWIKEGLKKKDKSLVSNESTLVCASQRQCCSSYSAN